MVQYYLPLRPHDRLPTILVTVFKVYKSATSMGLKKMAEFKVETYMAPTHCLGALSEEL